MTPSLRISSALALAALVLVPSARATVEPAASALQEAQPLRYVRASASAKLFNVPDTKGVAVAEVAGDTLLAVYSESAGWLSVEPPQGLKAWVYGQFLKPTSQPGVAEVTGDGVRIRPKPSSTNDSFPLEQHLYQGDRVRAIGRADAKKALREDWVQIVTPPGVRAWVKASETGAVDPALDVRAAWMAAVKDAQTKVEPYELRDPASVAAAASAGATKEKGAQDKGAAQDAWSAAEAQYEKAKAAGAGADWAAVRSGYQRYLDAYPQGAYAPNAKARLEEVGIREEIVRLQQDVQLREQQRQQKLAEAQERLREASRAQDPLWGRFQARGWMQPDPKEPRRWLLMWSGKPAAEITCSSGRYDLSVFQGCELGVVGVTVRASAGGLARYDATRIEVLSARTGG